MYPLWRSAFLLVIYKHWALFLLFLSRVHWPISLLACGVLICRRTEYSSRWSYSLFHGACSRESITRWANEHISGQKICKGAIEDAALASILFSVAAWVIFLVAACRVFSCGMWTLSCCMWGLVPWPGVEPGPVALGVWSLSHWTTREVLKRSYPGQSIGEECVQSREHTAAIWWTYRNSVSLGVYNEGLGQQ